MDMITIGVMGAICAILLRCIAHITVRIAAFREVVEQRMAGEPWPKAPAITKPEPLDSPFLAIQKPASVELWEAMIELDYDCGFTDPDLVTPASCPWEPPAKPEPKRPELTTQTYYNAFSGITAAVDGAGVGRGSGPPAIPWPEEIVKAQKTAVHFGSERRRQVLEVKELVANIQAGGELEYVRSALERLEKRRGGGNQISPRERH